MPQPDLSPPKSNFHAAILTAVATLLETGLVHEPCPLVEMITPDGALGRASGSNERRFQEDSSGEHLGFHGTGSAKLTGTLESEIPCRPMRFFEIRTWLPRRSLRNRHRRQIRAQVQELDCGWRLDVEFRQAEAPQGGDGVLPGRRPSLGAACHRCGYARAASTWQARFSSSSGRQLPAPEPTATVPAPQRSPVCQGELRPAARSKSASTGRDPG